MEWSRRDAMIFVLIRVQRGASGLQWSWVEVPTDSIWQPGAGG